MLGSQGLVVLLAHVAALLLLLWPSTFLPNEVDMVVVEEGEEGLMGHTGGDGVGSGSSVYGGEPPPLLPLEKCCEQEEELGIEELGMVWSARIFATNIIADIN